MKLIVLAAGLGRRFGGDKQTTGVGPRGEWLLDYALYDAQLAGFESAVLVVRPGMEDLAQRTFSLPVALALQDTPGTEWGRKKPWGTAHALWAARKEISGPFAVVNADDFYGRETYQQLANFLRNECSPQQYALPGFPLQKTLSPNGTVSRALLRIRKNGLLERIEEWKKLERTAEGAGMYTEEGHFQLAPEEARVSMNFWALHPSIFEYLAEAVPSFLNTHRGDKTIEFLLPDLIQSLMQEQNIRVKVLPSPANWLGVTYSSDLQPVQQQFFEWTKEGLYPSPLLKEDLPAEVLRHFAPDSILLKSHLISTGHIHKTIYALLKESGGERERVFQRINPHIFKDTDRLVNNALQIEAHLKRADYPFEPVPQLKGKGGSHWAMDKKGGRWRAFPYVQNSYCRTQAENIEEVRQAAEAIGHLHSCLRTFNPLPIQPAIPGFFDLAWRWQQWTEALENALPERRVTAKPQIEALEARQFYVDEYEELKAMDQMPIRLLHGDPKLSNLLFDKHSQKVRAIVDWDTAQPGWIIFEFGDMVRSYTNPGGEDGDLSSKEAQDKHDQLYTIVWKGFLKYTDDWLTPGEKTHLPIGARWVIWMQALRFLADYLIGDNYYPVAFPDQNLERAKTHLALLRLVEKKNG
jgi:Ser/Thr protein kinase RdoA (MazF antagonist)/NDP-sugar pyrophosphorylase family protein